MNITVNGEGEAHVGPAPLIVVLGGRGGPGTAVAVNGRVVPLAEHLAHLVGEGDAVEIVTAVQGG